MKKYLLIFLCCSLSFSLEIKDLSRVRAKYVEGNFTQIKVMKNFPIPFKSSGKFKILNSNELFWTTATPIKNEIKIDSNGIFILSENNIWKKMDNSVDKGILLDLLLLNEKSIKDIFKLNLKGDISNWVLELKPKNFFLKKIFNFIIVSGGEDIKRLDINETRGDFSRIDFRVIKRVDE